MSGAKGATMKWATDRTDETTRGWLGAAMTAIRGAGRALDTGAARWLRRPRVRRCGLVMLEGIGVLLLVAGAEVLAPWLLAG